MIFSFIKILNNISTAINFYLHFYETNKNNLKDIRRIDPTEYLFELTIIAIIKLCVCPDFSHSKTDMPMQISKTCFYDFSRTFLPSSSCDPCAKTLSTLAGSEKVMNPNPLKWKRRKKKIVKKSFVFIGNWRISLCSLKFWTSWQTFINLNLIRNIETCLLTGCYIEV